MSSQRPPAKPRPPRRPQLLVIGFGADHCPKHAYHLGYQVGHELARHQAILLTGGLGGVMEAAAKGAQEAGGVTVGILPYDEPSQANPYCDIVIATGLGYARNYVTSYSADAVLLIGGGVGTLIEASVAYQKAKPLIAVKGSGGIADKYAGRYLDDRKLTRIEGAKTPEQAVRIALAKIR